MTTRTSRHERLIQSIVETDRRIAVANADEGYVTEACELAPLSYAAMRALRGTPALGEALAALPDDLVRAQAVRFLVERRATTGAMWGWGDVDDVQQAFQRVIAATRAEAFAAQVGEEQAARIGELMKGEAMETIIETAYKALDAAQAACDTDGYYAALRTANEALDVAQAQRTDEALAQQLLGELRELEAMSVAALAGERYPGEAEDLDAAYARKKARVEALGYALTVNDAGALVLVEAGCPAPRDDGGYALPAPALVRDALARMAATAQAAGDTANANALNRADYQISRGIYPAVVVSADGALLVPSKETAGTVYRVGATGCSCTAGVNGRPCWHAALAEALVVACEEAAQALDDEAEYRYLTQTTGRMVA